MFAVSSVEAAKLYYETLNNLQKGCEKPLTIATIFSFAANEEQNAIGEIQDETFEPTAMDSSAKEFLTMAINDYNKKFKTNFGVESKEFQNYYRDLANRVKSQEVDLLIVVGMFLTGFDAPTLNTLFVDKNLRYHGLMQAFSRMVQNKFHYAITGQTAAEIIDTKADHTKEHMGLTTWKNSPDGRILKSDVTIAKNYLDEKQIRQLERAVTGYFDYIEDLIERENTFTMTEFAASINEFLAFRKYDVLEGKGRISKKTADRKAVSEYVEFNKTQKIVSDFDKEVKKMLQGGEGGNE